MSDPALSTHLNCRSQPLAVTLVLALLRIGIGWHFLYEGLAKVLSPGWSAAGYLRAGVGPFADLLHRLSANESAMRIIDLLNIWGLILIGGCLMLGLAIRFAAVCGIALLGLYYAAYPPLFASLPAGTTEGEYLIVSKNLVEMLALAAVIAIPARQLGLDGILAGWRASRKLRRDGLTALPGACAANGNPYLEPSGLSRRRILAGLMGSPFVGAFVLSVMKKRGYISMEEKNLEQQPDGRSGATRKFDFSTTLKDLKGRLPTAKIGNVELSRMIMGGNLIGGWAHARDLVYVSKLIKAYHHRQKCWETFRLAEACGVNTILTNPALCDIIRDYWRNAGGRIQFISDCGPSSGERNEKTLREMIEKSVDNGACACYIQGEVTDRLVPKEEFDLLARMLELIRKCGVPAGIGAHALASVQGCAARGVEPDFWVKTLHHTDYWSARPGDPPEKRHDNIWCADPGETIAFMKELPQPWIAFKVLAAGAIEPKVGFRYAFEGGADFICVGMYDFQIVEDVNIALDVLNSKPQRQRAWCA